MTSLSTSLCSLCQGDDVSSPAVSRCLECEVWLCTDCEKHHRRSKTSNNHKTVEVDAFDKFPPFVLKLSKRCTLHDQGLDQFCSFHGEPCCVQCISKTHKNCSFRPLSDVLQNIREAAIVSHLETDLNEMLKGFETVKNHLLERLIDLESKTKECINEIKRVRMSVNEQLDVMERNILDELSQIEVNTKQTIESLMNEIEANKCKVIDLQDSLLKIKQYATDLQIFLSIKEMQKQTSEIVLYQKNLEKENRLVDVNLNMVVSSALQSFQEDVVEFGKISVNFIPASLKLYGTKQGQAQSLSAISTLDNVNLVKKITMNLTGRQTLNITACVIFPTGECVFADCGNDRLVLYDSTNSYQSDVFQLTGLVPSDMCYIQDKMVGITIPDKQEVYIIDVSKSKVMNIISLSGHCSGIDYNNYQLFVRLPEKETVVVMNVDGKINNRVRISGKEVAGIACYKSYIFCRNWKRGEVSCYDMKGKNVWKHKYESLITPEVIAIEKITGIIYVADQTANNLLAITSDGNRSEIVLSEEDGLHKPQSVHAGTNGKLLVCNRENAFLYQCVHMS